MSSKKAAVIVAVVFMYRGFSFAFFQHKPALELNSRTSGRVREAEEVNDGKSKQGTKKQTDAASSGEL